MRKTYSGRKVLLRMFLSVVIVSLLALMGCGTYALYSTQQELIYCSEAAMNLSFSGMTHILEDLTAFSENMYASDPDFRTLALTPNSVSEVQLLKVKFNLRRAIHNRISANTGIMVFDIRRGEQYYQWGQEVWQGMLQQETIRAVNDIREYWMDKNDEQLGWQVFMTEDNKPLLIQARRFRDVILCTALDISSYSQTNEREMSSSAACAFLTRDRILTNQSYIDAHGITLEEMLASCDTPQFFRGNVLQTRLSEASGLGICCMNSMDGVWGYWRTFVILLGITMVLLCLVSVVVFRAVDRMLIYPMKKITEITGLIGSGTVTIPKTPERIQEIDDIQNALGTLVEQKVILETERSKQEAQKEHAMLQYYQLQTRSHFLLNCLKSIYNLAARREQEKTLRIVTRFSNHIRYVFHDSLTFVTVRAELEEVDDYFEIIGLERTDHILLSKSVDPKLMEFPIPPLLIQTFVENFQKHNAQSDRVLRFTIKIDWLKMEGCKYVRIRLSDNGVGYPEEVLVQMQEQGGDFTQYHVGIQNLCRRMDILYKKQHKIAFFNLPNGGACSVFYLPADSFLEDEPEEENDFEEDAE